jgi:mannose-6-phosphate isomerase
MMQPFRLLPIVKARPWGVHDASAWLGPHAPGERVGEAWFTANDSRTADGTRLGDLLASRAADLLGTACLSPSPQAPVCPLLLKLLFTSARLSVQVHPDDGYAREHHDALGKTEAWHVLDAAPGATVGLGFTRALSRDEALAAARSGAIEHLLDWRPAAAGDTFLVPARTVHAIGAGLTIAEVQEHSDVTYRLYDYGRPRELHLERGFAVAELGPCTADRASRPLASGRTLLARSDYFVMERIEPAGTLEYDPIETFYHLLVVLEGRGTLQGQPLEKGHVWFVPARAGRFAIEGRGLALLVAYTSGHPTRAFGAPRETGT